MILYGGYVRWLQVDIKKAFVLHFHLLYVVILSNRWPRAICSSGACSSGSPVTSKVPQGSALSCSFRNYDERFPLHALHALVCFIREEQQDDLNHRMNWSSNLKPRINVDKFQSATISKASILPPNLLLNHVQILDALSNKYLYFQRYLAPEEVAVPRNVG